MRFIRQFLIIICISFMGEVLRAILPFPIPASIYGLLLMLAALHFQIIKLHQVKQSAFFLIDIMPLMFIPATVGLMDIWEDLVSILIPLIVISVISTVLVMGISAIVAQFFIKGGKKHE